jgi:hypothetical protein
MGPFILPCAYCGGGINEMGGGATGPMNWAYRAPIIFKNKNKNKIEIKQMNESHPKMIKKSDGSHAQIKIPSYSFPRSSNRRVLIQNPIKYIGAY